MSVQSFFKKIGVKDFGLWKIQMRAPGELHYLQIYADGEWVYFRGKFWTYMLKVLMHPHFGTQELFQDMALMAGI